MKNLFAVGLVLLAFTGCSIVQDVSADRFALNNRSGRIWLSDQSAPASLNISGNWTSSDWGRGSLRQTGRTVRGDIGGYDVQGVVSGSKVYLLFASNGWFYYSAILESPSPGVLTGRFSRAIPFVRTLARTIHLDQLAN